MSKYTNNENEEKYICLTVDPDKYEDFKTIAKLKNRKYSNLIQDSIDKYVSRHLHLIPEEKRLSA